MPTSTSFDVDHVIKCTSEGQRSYVTLLREEGGPGTEARIGHDPIRIHLGIYSAGRTLYFIYSYRSAKNWPRLCALSCDPPTRDIHRRARSRSSVLIQFSNFPNYHPNMCPLVAWNGLQCSVVFSFRLPLPTHQLPTVFYLCQCLQLNETSVSCTVA